MLMPFIWEEMSIMQQVVHQSNLNVKGDLAMVLAFLIGLGYHSHVHINFDIHYTLLTVLGPEDADDNKVIYSSVFQHTTL